MKVAIRPEGVHAPQNDAYSHAVAAGNLLFIAGQVPLDAQGAVVGPGDIRAQARQVFENLGTVLRAAGLGFEHLVSCTAFIVDIQANYSGYADIRSQYLAGAPKPAMAIVEVSRLVRQEFLFELQAIAAAPGPKAFHASH